ncbi:MAG: dihydroorotase [Candidatus Borkfalkiaceae bacterium]|nr:dihydroorotase [Clostridia bacterium]MDY6222857.1 dihydroorotase [Christensenellaceae bacterium]
MLFTENNRKKEKYPEKYAFLIGRFLQNHSFAPVVSENGEYIVFPGFCDVHVHFREPGFSYKETIATGSAAAARGGYTAVCTMPNLSPVPDSLAALEEQLSLIRRDAKINVFPYGAITKGEKGETLSDMAALSPYVCAFSDDGRGVQSEEIMRAAMREARRLNKPIAAHCEDNSLLSGGYIHDGAYAKAHNHKGISSASEYRQIERDLALAKETGVKYHACHISTKESVELIRKAKREGVDVTCETAPHYLVLTQDDLQEDGRFKMNPPLRNKEDRQALIDGLNDGTVDMIATDHAPHSIEEKSKGLSGSAFGISGLETAFAALYTKLVKTGAVPLEKLLKALCDTPRKRFSLPQSKEDFTVFQVKTPYKINTEEFLSKGKSTPFCGEEVYGRCVLTVCGGKIVWQDNSTENSF